MGREHLNGLLAHKGFIATAVCDIDPKRVAIASQDYPGIQTYTDVDEMLAQSDVELLVIILPHNVHAEVALKCLRAGKHVVVEKPFALTVKECDAMIAAARKHKRLLTTYHNRHWDSNILTIRKHLKKIGRPFRWESFQGGYSQPGNWWRSNKAVSGGVIFDWGAHFVEWMLQVLPHEMVEISGYKVDEVWKTTNEDEVEAVVRFKNSSVGMHTASDVAAAGKDMIRITGTKGAIIATHTSVDVIEINSSGEKVRTSVAMEPRRWDLYYKNVRDHLIHGKELIITPEKARRVIQVLDFASRSATENKTLKPRYS
jgi:predicted dehydrogenase